MSEYLEKRKREEQREEELALQKKQLFAQRVGAAAAVANAALAAQTAAEVEKMRREASAAAETAERHQRLMVIQQAEMAERQEQMADEQRLTNFRQTVLTTLPLLKEEEKAQYVIEQLSPAIEKKCEEKTSNFQFRAILKVFKFLDFSENFCASAPDAKNFLAEGRANPKQKLNEATVLHRKANEELEKITKSTAEDWFAAIIAAGVVALIFFFASFYFLKSQVPHDANKLADPGAVTFICYPGSMLFSLVTFVFFLKKTRKEAATTRLKKVSDLSAKVLLLKTDMDRETETFEKLSKQQPETWKKIKTNLVDSYLASEWGEKLLRHDMFQQFMILRMDIVAEDQRFLPPSARPTDEQWQAVFKSKVEPEAELATQRLSKIKDILLCRLTPNYDTQQFEIEDLDEKFIELDIQKTDASSDEPMSDKEVGEMMASLTELIQMVESSGMPEEEVLTLQKNIAADQLEYLRSAITTHSPVLPSRLEKISKKYEEQRAHLQVKAAEELRVFKEKHPEKFS